MTSRLYLAVMILAAAAAGQDLLNLTGTWQLDASKSDLKTMKLGSATWVIEEADNSIHITQSEGGKSKKVEVQCTTDGKECNVTGDKAKASFWYNAGVLVEMETKGDRITRYRMKVSQDAKTLTVEVNHLVPQNDKVDTLVFTKS